jgi:hypothetical protein
METANLPETEKKGKGVRQRKSPQKTRLIEFGKYASGNRKRKGKGKPETFDFLGFTHMCSKNRKGDFFLRRKTKRKQLKKRRHEKIKETGKWLATVITGHRNYFAVPGNMDAVKEFYKQCMRQWLRTLRRRSHKAQKLTWEVFLMKVEELIPRPRMVHPFPEQRFWRQELEVGAVYAVHVSFARTVSFGHLPEAHSIMNCIFLPKTE